MHARNTVPTQQAFEDMIRGTHRTFFIGGFGVLAIAQDDEQDFMVRTTRDTHYLSADSEIEYRDPIPGEIIPAVDGGPSQLGQEHRIMGRLKELQVRGWSTDGLRLATDDELMLAANQYRGDPVAQMLRDYIVIRQR